jgi:protocatechuate 3,4-dioxygenase beta subunit
VQSRFAKDYVVVMIDQDRMTEGKETASQLRKGKRGGIPWMVILDEDGHERVTSDGPKGNVGCPAQPHEIDYFLSKMVDSTRKHMSDEDRTVIGREMRSHGAKLVRRNVPGRREFSAVVKDLKMGRFQAAVKQLATAIEAGYAPESIPTDPALRALREDPARRLELFELVKKNVATHQVQVVDRLEAGHRIRLDGRIVDMETGKPISGALMQVFHTDATGEYRPGMDAGGGAGNPRLWAYLRTDNDGKFTVDTIMPERYQNSSVPRHVHYRVWAEGYADFASECFFDADPLLSDKTRKAAPGRNFPIVRLKKDSEARAVGALTVRVPKK